MGWPEYRISSSPERSARTLGSACARRTCGAKNAGNSFRRLRPPSLIMCTSSSVEKVTARGWIVHAPFWKDARNMYVCPMWHMLPLM